MHPVTLSIQWILHSTLAPECGRPRQALRPAFHIDRARAKASIAVPRNRHALEQPCRRTTPPRDVISDRPALSKPIMRAITRWTVRSRDLQSLKDSRQK